MAKREAAMVVAVMEAVKKEVANSVQCYKASVAFKDEVREVVHDAFIKGFEECKKKMAQLFHFPDLQDVIPIESEEDLGDVEPPIEAILAELPGLKGMETHSITPQALSPMCQPTTPSSALV